MKRFFKQIIIIAFSTAFFTTSAQTQTDGFWGIPFRSAQAEVLKVAAAKGYKPIKKDDKNIVYEDVPFAGTKTYSLIFSYHLNRLASGMAKFKYNSSVLALNNYNEWKKKLIEKYGAPIKDIEQLPSYLKDSKENILLEHALKTGEAKFMCLWTATDRGTKESSVVTVNLSDDNAIEILLTDVPLSSEMLESEKEANSRDY